MQQQSQQQVPVEQWDTTATANWISSVGFPQYWRQFKDNGITGEVLLNTTVEMLRELKIKSVGHRIAICKAVRQLRLANGYPLEDEPSSATGML